MNDNWISQLDEEVEELYKCLDAYIAKEKKELQEFKKNTELLTKIQQETKLKEELNLQLISVSKRCDELERLTLSMGNITIAESDKNRLDNAKNTYEIAKEMTGVRFDFSAPPTLVKGYIKSKPRKLLEPFEMSQDDPSVPDKLWTLIQAVATTGWPNLTTLDNVENVPSN